MSYPAVTINHNSEKDGRTIITRAKESVQVISEAKVELEEFLRPYLLSHVHISKATAVQKGWVQGCHGKTS